MLVKRRRVIPWAPEQIIPDTSLRFIKETEWAILVECLAHQNRFEVQWTNLKSKTTRGCQKNAACVAQRLADRLAKKRAHTKQVAERAAKEAAVRKVRVKLKATLDRVTSDLAALEPDKSTESKRIEKLKETKAPNVGPPSTSELAVWQEIKDHCLHPTTEQIQASDRTGIYPTICDRWLKFDAFFKDMGPRPRGKSLVRINDRFPFGPSNARWE